ncbi:unnamed protein product [Brachionus calyciflorus]|uniref:Triokinase/FMN cyclase n=1 Tax=Brachionus calyciflorus TaxID=104777 RepID=A0A813M1V8_9BILA|nr:unnamed protein product [Brachionus calyciflorus]
MSKHLINKQEDWARESIKGFIYSNNQNLIALEEYANVIARKDYLSLAESSSRVALISGGGSGHEPAHLSFVGYGMLTAVVCGDLFASPSTSAILAAIRLVGKNNKAGVLLIVKNYTGDRLNFGLAAKRAQLEGINVDWILVDDDVALQEDENQRDSSVGKRGICGTVLIHKIAGALAEQRKSLKEIKEILDFILKNGYLKTIGVSLSGRVPLPGEKNPSIYDPKIEIGLGIHGEAGRHKTDLTNSKNLVKYILDDYLFKTSEKEICLMINNLGGLSNLELGVLTNDCLDYLLEFKSDIKVNRVYTGTFMTSLNMNGFSITVLGLDQSNKELILNLLDAKTEAPGWPRNYGVDIKKFEYLKSSYGSSVKEQSLKKSEDFLKFSDVNLSNLFEFFLKTIAEDLIDLKDHLNMLDSVCGDGDCGNSLANISQKILQNLSENKFKFDQPHQVFLELSEIFENGGGSLCILLSLFMSSAAKAFSLKSLNTRRERDHYFWVELWKNALRMGLDAVEEYGRAKPGQRSIVDPLSALNNFLNDYLESYESKKMDTKGILKQIVDVVYNSAESTARMKPRVGRASYVDISLINSPDAGAMGISSIFTSIYKAYLQNE